MGFGFKKLASLLTAVSVGLLAVFLLSLLASPARSFLKESPTVAVFNEAWQKVNDNFYDPKFNGVDWRAIRKKYEPLAAKTQSIKEASLVINQMLSELKSSHTYFYPQSEPAYYQLLGIFKSDNLWKQLKRFFPDGNINYPGIGIFTKDIGGQIFINAILENSPALAAGLKVGDQLLSVDGAPYQPIQSFVDKVGKEVKLSIARSRGAKGIDLIVIPQKLDPTQMFLEAMRSSVEIIERDGKKIGYIHIWSYAGDQYQQELVQEITYGKLREADGLILDLKDGWGGAVPSYLNIFTGKVPTLTQILRDGKKTDLEYQWKKPVVMLVNQGSRSGKEILAYGFQQYDIGAVIGTKTAGAVLAGRPFLLQDGSLLYLAVADVFVNGKRLEGNPVVPDIEVPFRLEYAEGKDPQKEKAVEVLAEVIKHQG